MPDVRKFWDEDGHYKCRFCNKAHPNSYDTFVKIETRKAVGFGSCQFRGILNAKTKKEIVQETICEMMRDVVKKIDQKIHVFLYV